MTQDKNQGSENLSWMEIADADATNEARNRGQRLPFIAAAVSLVIIAGGAVFAQTSNEAPAEAEVTSVTQTSQTPSTMSDAATTSPSTATPSIGTPAMTPGAIPVIPNVAPSVARNGDDEGDERHGRNGDDDDREDEEDDD
jgi:hypothetical protein